MKSQFSKIAPQLRCPSGKQGIEVGKFMDKLNDPQNDWVLSLLNLKLHDTVLEIGFGTGKTIQKALNKVTQGAIYGIDLSDTMFGEASRLLHTEIAQGKVKLSKGNSENLPFENNSINKIYAVHVVYFWKDIQKVLSELYRINTAGGITAIYFVSPILEPSLYFHEYTVEELSSAFMNSGYKNIRTFRQQFEKQNGICIIGSKIN